MPRKSSFSLAAGTPAPVTITTPDVVNLEAQAQLALSPATGFVVIDNDTFIEAGERYNAVVAFINSVTESFKEPKALAYKAHKAVTALEAKFLQPALLAKEHLAFQQLDYRRRLEALRLAEERRIREEQQRLADIEHAKQQAILDAEVEAQRKRLEEDKLPWEFTEEDEQAVERIVLPEPEVAPIRLPSNVPYVVGGPVVRKKPFAGRCLDIKKLIIEAGKRAEAGDDYLIKSGVLQIDQVKLNDLAREHQGLLKDVFPGCEAYQGETLARG